MDFNVIEDKKIPIREDVTMHVETERNRYEFVALSGMCLSEICFQNGVESEYGINGLQVSDVLHCLIDLVERFQEKLPCAENEETLTGLKTALSAQEKRDADRKQRKVEGTKNK